MSIFSRDLKWFVYCCTEPVKQKGRIWATIGLDFDKGRDLPHVIRKVNTTEKVSLGRLFFCQKEIRRYCNDCVIIPGDDSQQTFLGNHKRNAQNTIALDSFEMNWGYYNKTLFFFFFPGDHGLVSVTCRNEQTTFAIEDLAFETSWAVNWKSSDFVEAKDIWIFFIVKGLYCQEPVPNKRRKSC